MRPEDVFDLVEKNNREKGFIIENFKEKRVNAQEQLGLTNPDISEIYKAFQDSFHITLELAQKYLDEEIAVEKRVLVPRKDMVLIFKECLDRGKRYFWLQICICRKRFWGRSLKRMESQDMQGYIFPVLESS